MRAHVLLALTFLGLTAARAVAADAVLLGAPTVSPSPLVPGSAAEVTVTLRADAKKPTSPVQLEVFAGKTLVGKLADAPLAANQTKAYKIPVKVPPDAVKRLELRILGWGAVLGQVAADVKEGRTKDSVPVKQAVPPASQRQTAPPPAPSLTQTVTTARLSGQGNRGSGPRATPVLSLAQTVTTARVSGQGNRGPERPAPPVPSLTQTVTTPGVSGRGNR